MRYIWRYGLCLIAVLAVFGGAAATASAIENPTWVACEEGSGSGTKYEDEACTKESGLGKLELFTLLSSSETRELGYSAGGVLQKLNINGNHIKCKLVKASEGSDVAGGSNGGTAKSLFQYEECAVEEHPSCTINEGTTLKSGALDSTVVYTTKLAAEQKNPANSAVLFKPHSGAFFSGKMTGTGCPKPGTYEVTGEALYVVAEATKHIKEHRLEPSSEKHYFINESGKVVERTVTTLKDGTEEEPVVSPVLMFILGFVIVVRIIAACMGI